MATLTVEITTPESVLFNGDAAALMARSREGEFTILPAHTAVVGNVVPGVVRVATTEGEQRFCVHGGFFQVSTTEGATIATVLCGVAEPVGAIDVARAQRAKDAAEAALNGRGDDVDEVKLAEAREALDRAELRLSVAGAA